MTDLCRGSAGGEGSSCMAVNGPFGANAGGGSKLNELRGLLIQGAFFPQYFPQVLKGLATLGC